ncbi:MAG TPA: hypothetical protein VIH57_17245 [Bacteroidales bacterium]
MHKNGEVMGNMSFGNNRVSFKLPIIAFEEDGAKIVYCPALDLSGYGLDENEADESFKISLDQFISYTIHKNTLDKELRRLGWKVKTVHKR